jgi:hypothetical protein
MWILIVTFVSLIVVESVLVGLSAAAVSMKARVTVRTTRLFLIFVAIFAVLDNFYLPALQVLDATLVIRNPDFSRLIGPGAPIELAEWLGPSPDDALWWALQGTLALITTRITMGDRWAKGQ